MTLTVLNSKIDRSVNFIEEQLVGFLESRFVRKTDDYFICYLSSQTGCNRGCKFCHLTATQQLSFTNSNKNDYISQLMQVLRHYKAQQKPAKYIHLNFMARGEILANPEFLDNADDILWSLGDLAKNEGLSVKYNISTIMPLTLKKSLVDIFKVIHPTIYYSLYSVKENFRKTWMPGAMGICQALESLKEYQKYSKKIIKIHFPMIAGENDSLEDLGEMCSILNIYKLKTEFNLVRYNPFSQEQGEESSDEILQRNMKFLKENINGKVQAIVRVGTDIAASCGVFVNDEGKIV